MAECNETTSKTMMMMNMKAAMQIVRKSYTPTSCSPVLQSLKE